MDREQRKMEILVKNFKSKDANPVHQAARSGSLFNFGGLLEENPSSEERYRIAFEASSRDEKQAVLRRKI